MMVSLITIAPMSASAARWGDYEYTVSNGKVTITDFWNYDISDITIPRKINGYPVTAIGEWAFSGNFNLTNVNIPDSVTEICNYAFCACPSLTSVDLPNSITHIAEATFAGCSSLSRIVIPKIVTSIEDDAFHYCESLTDVYYTGRKEDWKKISVGSSNDGLSNATIHYNYRNPSKKYTVRFDTNGGTGTYSSQSVVAGTFMSVPKRPTRNGYSFTGWYANRACTGTPYISASGVVNRTVTQNITLYAGWKKNDVI